MPTVFFFLNILLIVIYAITALLGIQCLSNKKKDILLNSLTGIFLLYIIDVLIIFAAEFLLYANSAERIVESVITAPTLKIFAVFGLFICYTLAYLKLLKRDLKWYSFIPVAILLIVSNVCVWLDESNFVVWCFYSVRQFIVIGFCVHYFYIVKTEKDEEYREFLLKYKKFFVFVTVMMVIILLEDSFVIFNIEKVLKVIPHMNEKNISENIFCIIFSFIAMRFFMHNTSKGDQTTETIFVNKEIISEEECESRFADKYRLTPREKEIFRLILKNKSNQEISDDLYITIGTVKTHIHKIFDKTDVSRKAQLIQKFESEKTEEKILE